MRNIFVVLLCTLTILSQVIASTSSLLDMKMKRDNRLGKWTFGKPCRETTNFVSLKQASYEVSFCYGYLVNGNFMATRAYCVTKMSQQEGKRLNRDIRAYIYNTLPPTERLVLDAYYPISYIWNDPRSPDDFALLRLENPQSANLVTIPVDAQRSGQIPEGQELTMMVLTHAGFVKRVTVHNVDLKKCDIASGDANLGSENQLCVQLFLVEYLEIEGKAFDENYIGVMEPRIITSFASGSPVFLEKLLVGIVSNSHVHDGQRLNVHCTDVSKFAWHIANVNSPTDDFWNGWQHVN